MSKRRSDAYTLADAAARLGLKPATLRTQIANGKLIAYKFGRDWIVDAHEVERYALEHRRAPPAAAGYASSEADMHWHADGNGKPCACIEPEHDAAPRVAAPA